MNNCVKYQNPDQEAGQINLIFQTRMLWRNMGSWIRAYIISLYANIGDQDIVKQRLYKVPVEFGNVFRLFFGDQPTEKLVSLLTNYITLLVSVLEAQKNNDVNGVNEYTKQLYENIDQIAELLSQINPFWQESDWKTLLYKYTQTTIEEAAAFYNKDYTRNIEIYDGLLTQASTMGDHISEGLLDYLKYSR